MKLFDLKSGKQIVSEKYKLNFQDKKFMIGSNEYEPDDTKAYFTFTLVHSWPNINGNGVTFSAKTLERSHATIKDNPIDVDHKLEGNGMPLFNGNEIIGHMIDSSVEVVDGVTSILVAGVMYKRVDKALDIIVDLSSGGSEWATSMEVLYKPDDSGFMLADNTYIPLADADESLVDAFQSGSSLYDGQKFGFLAGGTGEDGDGANVNFWGAAMTEDPADKNATVHTMVASKMPRSLIGADAPRVIIVSDGPVESTRLLIDGAEVSELRDVEFFSWPGYDTDVWLDWTVKPQDIGGVTKNSRFTLIANEIIGDIGMIKMKEFLENFPTQISEAVNAAVASSKEGEMPNLKAIETLIAEKLGELKDWVSPDDVEAKATEIADAKIKERDDLATKIAGRVEKAEAAGIVMNPARLKEIASLEDEKVDDWITTASKAVAEMVAALEEKHGVTVGEDVEESLKGFNGVDSPEFGAYSSAIATMVKNGASLKSGNSGPGDDDDNEPKAGLG